jgi:hypothetical protein
MRSADPQREAVPGLASNRQASMPDARRRTGIGSTKR